MSRNKKLYLIAILLLVLTIACSISGVILDFHLVQGREARHLVKVIHRYTGYGFMALAVFHTLYNLKFFRRLPK